MKVGDESKAALWWVTAGILVGMAVSLALSGGLGVQLNWSDGGTWIGQNGIIGSLVGVLTLAGVAAGAWGVYLNNRRSLEALRITERSEISNLYMRGVQMLNADRQSEQIGGISLLLEACRADITTFARPAIKALVFYVSERGRPLVEEAEKRLRATPRQELVRASQPTLDAIGVVKQIMDLDPSHRRQNGFTINDAYMAGWDYTDPPYSNLTIASGLVSNFTFIRGTLEDTTLRVQVGTALMFFRTNLTNARLIIERVDGRPLTPRDTRTLYFGDCTEIGGATINGFPLADWIRSAEGAPWKPNIENLKLV